MYFERNRTFFSARADVGTSANRFYGIGPESPDRGWSDYTMFGWGIRLEIQFKPFFVPLTRSGWIYEYRHDDVTDKQSNPLLKANHVTGSDGGVVSGAGYAAVEDTRDHLFFPNRGGLYSATLMIYSDMFGSDFNYNMLTIELRQYRALKPDHVLAFQVYGQFAGGNTPFYQLPAVGGQNRMRGYFYGRYADQLFVTGQAEYRQYFWRRLGFVIFAGAGDVAPDWKTWKFRHLKFTAGAGLRIKFNEAEKINLRVDLAVGRQSSGVYFGLQEAF